ncbi:MAG: glycosyltransferase family 39 protein [Dehalococcoidia bacterium]
MTDPPPVGAALANEVAVPAARSGGLTVRVDVLLWLGLIAAAATLRLARLDALSLTLDESARVFDALRVSQNSVPEGWSGDLAAAITSYLFRIFGDSEFVARVAPAVAGSAMVAAVWLCGRGLGRVGALVAGALLAFSPLALLLSRAAVPFSLGGLLAVGMTAALFSYLREPRALTAFLFAVAFGLAPSTDAVAATAAIAVVAFLFAEPVLSEESAVARAWGVFRRSPSHWLSVVLVLAASLELGLTHFGTSVDRLGLAGLTQWSGMFALPRDSREPEYQMILLLAYDWPILLAGGIGAMVFVQRLMGRGAAALAPLQRFVLLWVALATLAVALATQREAGQLLILLVPLALLGALLAEDLFAALDWAVLRRWWLAVAVVVALVAYAALVTTDWSEGGIGRAERFSLALALGGAATLLVTSYSFLGRNAAVIGVAAAAVLAFAFLAHTGLSLTGNDDAAEFAVDIRTSGRIGQFRETVGELVASRAGPVLIDPGLREPLAWYLRDLPVTFARPGEEASALVVLAGQEVEGFTPLGEAWRLGQGWYPADLDPLPLWRWLVYRESYGSLDGVDAQILVPAP